MAKRITANARAVGKSTQFIAYTIIVLVVLYSDVMFISLMYDAFPDGFLRVAAIGGAFATGISVIALVIGKSHWFRPGGQLVWAWCFTALELTISILNVVVSVMVARHQPLGFLANWAEISPATPLLALIGWVVILYLDKERQNMHEDMEMQDEMAESEREHARQVHAARMELKGVALSQQKEYLKMHLSSADVQAALSAGSYEIARGIVSDIVQRPVMPDYSRRAELPAGNVVDSVVYSQPQENKPNKPVTMKFAVEEEKAEVRQQPKPFFASQPAATPRPKKKLPKLHRRKSGLGRVALASQGEKTEMK